MSTNTLTGAMISAEKKALSALIPAVRSFLLMFFLLAVWAFCVLILHEGGHAVGHWVQGGPVNVFYVHPFGFNGYVRPVFNLNNPWQHAAGPIAAILGSLLITLPFWKRRTTANLPVVMLFPWIATTHGLNMITQMIFRSGDFNNIVTITGLPRELFTGLGILVFGIGVILMFSLLPLLGLAPEDKKALFVIPGVQFLAGVLAIVVARIVVPGSRIDRLYSMGEEIIASANSSPTIGIIVGIGLALLYVTLYRFVYRRLPAGLRTEKTNLAWRDLRIPGLLFVVSVVIGIIAIR